MDDSKSSRRTGPSEQAPAIRLWQTSSTRASALGDDVQADTPPLSTALPAKDLFTILWSALADVLGTAAAATLLRRAAQRAVASCPELAELTITRERLEYRYRVPVSWKDPSEEAPHALRELARELCTLLGDLTGPVIVNRLAQIPELGSRGIILGIEAQP